jgi:hypothetical protein
MKEFKLVYNNFVTVRSNNHFLQREQTQLHASGSYCLTVDYRNNILYCSFQYKQE